GSISACQVDAVSPSTHEDPSAPKQTVVRITNPGTSAVLNTNNSSECVNYVKGRTFVGENYRLKFDHDSNVSVYGPDGHLVFGGKFELGATESEVSRWITARSISGGSALQFLLSNDGKLMEPGSLTIYRPE
ncbi:MAG: hypothetical protein ABIY71_06485, partial [Flavobacteriales bacterium]